MGVSLAKNLKTVPGARVAFDRSNADLAITKPIL